MDSKYWEWIQKNVEGDCRGQCREIVDLMVKAFPELTIVRGHYWCPLTNTDRGHFWCIDPKGIVVDPTQSQFPSQGLGYYTPLSALAKEPVGRCLNCGEYIYEEDGDPSVFYVCSEECSDAFHDSLMG